jgi:hypothetical protein
MESIASNSGGDPIVSIQPMKDPKKVTASLLQVQKYFDDLFLREDKAKQDQN